MFLFTKQRVLVYKKSVIDYKESLTNNEEKMKRYLFLFIALMTVVFGANAQNAGDKILGVYKAVQEGNVSKVRFTKNGNGYKAQIIWLEKDKNPDGTKRTDSKNSNAAKRNTPADQIVLIEKVTYDKNKDVWNGGKVYDPTKGKSFNVEVKFKDAKTLAVKGSLAIFSQTVYWTKIE